MDPGSIPQLMSVLVTYLYYAAGHTYLLGCTSRGPSCIPPGRLSLLEKGTVETPNIVWGQVCVSNSGFKVFQTRSQPCPWGPGVLGFGALAHVSPKLLYVFFRGRC